MKYGVFNEKGLPKAFYDSEIHKIIPSKAIKITDEQWQNLITGNKILKDGQVIDVTDKVWDDTQQDWIDKATCDWYLKQEQIKKYKKKIKKARQYILQAQTYVLDNDKIQARINKYKNAIVEYKNKIKELRE